MRTVCLHEKQEIWEFLQKDVFLHLYSIGDLDDFFWPYTTWYALMDGQDVVQLALVYCASSLPILITHSEEGLVTETQALLRSIIPFLPRKFYAHLQRAAAESLRQHYHLQSHGVHHKMALLRPNQLESVDTSRVNALTEADLRSLEELYHASYPDNWFDPRMLETGYYYGIRDGADLLSVAGIHTYSQRYGVAVLGNVTTHPAHRREHLATMATARLCTALLETARTIGLNVLAENSAAIACYTRLGFDHVATYEEFMCTLR